MLNKSMKFDHNLNKIEEEENGQKEENKKEINILGQNIKVPETN